MTTIIQDPRGVHIANSTGGDVNPGSVHSEINRIPYSFQGVTRGAGPSDGTQTKLFDTFKVKVHKAAQIQAFENFSLGPSKTRANHLNSVVQPTNLNVSHKESTDLGEKAMDSVRHSKMKIFVIVYALVIKMFNFERTKVYPAMAAVVDHYKTYDLAVKYGCAGVIPPAVMKRLSDQVINFGFLIHTFQHDAAQSTATTTPSQMAATSSFSSGSHGAPGAMQPPLHQTYHVVDLDGKKPVRPEHSAEASRRMNQLNEHANIQDFPAGLVKVAHFNHPLLFAVMTVGFSVYFTHFPHLRGHYNQDNPTPASAMGPAVGVVSVFLTYMYCECALNLSS